MKFYFIKVYLNLFSIISMNFIELNITSSSILLILIITILWIICCKFRNNRGKLPLGPYGVPYIGYLPLIGKVPCVTISNLSKKYGKMLTLQMGQYPVVFVNDFETIKELYKGDILTGRAQLSLFEKRGVNGIVLLEGSDWLEIRRFMMRCFRDLGFGKKSMETSINHEVTSFNKLLLESKNSALYLKPLIELSVINALWELLTSEKYDIEDSLKKKITHILTEGVANQNIVGLAAFLPKLAKLFPNTSGYNKGMEFFGAPEELAKEIIQKHEITYSSENERDFIDVFLTKIYSTTNPSSMFYKERGMKNLLYTLVDLFFAGSDTLSSTLGWAFLYLALYKNVQNKIHDEIDRVVGKLRIPSLADRQMMPYVEATMAEILRKSSIVPLGLFHAPIRDFSYKNFFFPKGTYFLANIYHVHHDENYWENPHEFKPERFLDFNGNFKKNERLIPFFTGKRNCPGENFALMEFFLFFTGILQKFSFEIDESCEKINLGPRAGFVITPPEHKLIVKER